MTKYRIINFCEDNKFVAVQTWRWWFPFWITCDFEGHPAFFETVEMAENFVLDITKPKRRNIVLKEFRR